MEQRYLVEIHPDFRQDVGQFETVVADDVEVTNDGSLMFNVRGGLVLLRASGTWITMVPEED